MATRSRIGIETKDVRGNVIVKSIYCHWDGYPENNGRILLENYQDREKVEKLIALGSISSLHDEVEPSGPHSFDSPQPDVTVAYHRDRGEDFDFSSPQVNYSREAFVRSDVEEYGYLFTLEGEWLFVNGHKNSSTREAIALNEVVND
jgi:hypothetical protein